MRKSVKIAISLPADLLEEADRQCEARGENRSEFFRYAVLRLLSEERERAAVEQYVEGYRRQPETEAEVAAADAIGSAALAEEPWE